MAYERTLVHIRERSFLDILDLALVVVRSRTRSLGLAALIGCAPFAAFNAWLIAQEFPRYGIFFLLLLEAPWATAPLTVLLGGLMFGRRPTAGAVGKRLLGGFPALFLFQGVLRGLLLIIPIFAMFIPYRLAFVNEVVLLERGKLGSVFKRSGDLSGDRGGDLFLRSMISFFFGLLFVTGFWFAWGVLQQLLFSGWTWDEPPLPDLVYSPAAQVATWLAISFFGIVRFLTYIDQRIRLEGWEVELRLRQVGTAMEDAEQW